MRACEVYAQNGFKLRLLKAKRDFAYAQLPSLREDLASAQRELTIAKQRCFELSKAVVTTEDGRKRVGLELSEAQGALEELS